jgi:hypothetical protein
VLPGFNSPRHTDSEPSIFSRPEDALTDADPLDMPGPDVLPDFMPREESSPTATPAAHSQPNQATNTRQTPRGLFPMRPVPGSRPTLPVRATPAPASKPSLAPTSLPRAAGPSLGVVLHRHAFIRPVTVTPVVVPAPSPAPVLLPQFPLSWPYHGVAPAPQVGSPPLEIFIFISFIAFNFLFFSFVLCHVLLCSFPSQSPFHCGYGIFLNLLQIVLGNSLQTLTSFVAPHVSPCPPLPTPL